MFRAERRKLMNDELVKSLRICFTDGDCKECVEYADGVECPGIFYLAWKAANAIEELQKRVPKTPHGRLIIEEGEIVAEN